jgi:hypothetical protein
VEADEKLNRKRVENIEKWKKTQEEELKFLTQSFGCQGDKNMPTFQRTYCLLLLLLLLQDFTIVQYTKDCHEYLKLYRTMMWIFALSVTCAKISYLIFSKFK